MTASTKREATEHLKAAIEALEKEIRRLAVQANLYEIYGMEAGWKDYVRRERYRRALDYLKRQVA